MSNPKINPYPVIWDEAETLMAARLAAEKWVPLTRNNKQEGNDRSYRQVYRDDDEGAFYSLTTYTLPVQVPITPFPVEMAKQLPIFKQSKQNAAAVGLKIIRNEADAHRFMPVLGFQVPHKFSQAVKAKVYPGDTPDHELVKISAFMATIAVPGESIFDLVKQNTLSPQQERYLAMVGAHHALKVGLGLMDTDRNCSNTKVIDHTKRYPTNLIDIDFELAHHMVQANQPQKVVAQILKSYVINKNMIDWRFIKSGLVGMGEKITANKTDLTDSDKVKLNENLFAGTELIKSYMR